MKSSHSFGSVELQSASLPGRFRRWEMALLRVTCSAAARDALRARGGQDDAVGDDVAGGAVGVEGVLDGGADDAVDDGRDLGVVEALLGLTLELRLRDLDREDGDDAFARVLGGDGHAARQRGCGR